MLRTRILSWRRITGKVRSWIDAVLRHTHDHYSIFLPERIGILSDFILDLFYSGIDIKPNQRAALNDIPKEAVIVYANKFKSRFDYLFYYSRYKKEKLPFPQIGLDYHIYAWQPLMRIIRIGLSHADFVIKHGRFQDPYSDGYIHRELLSGKIGFLSLVEKKGFYRRFVKEKTDPIHYLIELQRNTDRPVYIVPQLMFFNKKPSKQKVFRASEVPGIIRKSSTLFKKPEKIFIEISKPVDLRQFLARYENESTPNEYLSLILRRNLLLQINRHRQSITGPILKSRQEIKEGILTHERMRDFMGHFSESRNIPLQKIHKEADEYLEEIAANYRPTMILILEKVVRWMIRLMFDGVTINEDELNKVKLMSLNGPLVLVPCHKSHIDYLILSYILYQNNMQCPHVAAGKNLSFWPLGPIFRSGGAFFIRRTFKGAVLYSKIFAEYVYKMLEEGFTVEFFIEGTRSRTGKLLPPKLGFLSILLNAYKNGACDDLIFVPVYVGYDRVLEESSYLNELEGAQKKSEDLSQLIRARKFLKKRYGKIYVRFHEPMSLNALLNEKHARLNDMTPKEQNAFCRELGHRVVNAIDRNTIVTPHALVACAILNMKSNYFAFDTLMKQIRMYINYLGYQGADLADTLLIDYRYAIKSVLEDYEQRKMIEKISSEKNVPLEDAQYLVNESRRPGLEYYKNSCVTYFVPLAYTALAILKRDSFQFSASNIYDDYLFIQNLFRNEFFSDISRPPEYTVRKSIKAFIDEAALVPHPTLPDTYNITSAGLRSLEAFSQFLASYMESYLVAVHYFLENKENGISAKDRVKKLHTVGAAMYKNREIERKESLSRMNFTNAAEAFLTNGFKKSETDEQLAIYAGEIQRFLDVLRR
ncbi:MAG: 1-acyl-sn-glycerol-3-phosphate acyltransferase [Desulfobacterales bacterium]